MIFGALLSSIMLKFWSIIASCLLYILNSKSTFTSVCYYATCSSWKLVIYLNELLINNILHLATATTPKAHPLSTTSRVNQLENEAVDNIIIRCVDNGPSDGRADSISNHRKVNGRRRCRTVTATIDSCKLCLRTCHAP